MKRDGDNPLIYPWEGVALHGNTPFSTTLISHIEGNLWVGGCMSAMALPDDFRYVLSLCPWESYGLGDETIRVEFALHDAVVADDGFVHGIARMAAEFLRHGKTLVHCRAGLNRSCLIAALALMLEDGRSADEVIALLRERRSPAVLCNPHFEAWLRALLVW